MPTFLNKAKSFLKSVLSWHWTKQLLAWVIISAGTMSEFVFVVASLWICLNASVHSFVILFIPEKMTVNLTSLADTAYVGLPELILPLAIVTTISHFRVWLGQKKSIPVIIWLVTFGLPTIIFFAISVTTLGFSLASVGFQLPLPFVIVRGIAAYWYAIASILYIRLGLPQERDRLNEKDTIIENLRQENTVNLEKMREEKDVMIAQIAREKEVMQQSFTAKVNGLTAEIEHLKTILSETINAKTELQKTVNKSDGMALQAYSEECIAWLKSNHKTVMVDEIPRYTGHSKRKIEEAINKGLLQKSTRNKELILVSSLMEWLKNNQPIRAKVEQDTPPYLHVVNE